MISPSSRSLIYSAAILDSVATNAKVERLALNLRSYAYAMGAPRKDTDEEVALGAARLILEKLETLS